MNRDDFLTSFSNLVDATIEVALTDMSDLSELERQFQRSARLALETYARDAPKESMNPIERQTLEKVKEAVKQWPSLIQ